MSSIITLTQRVEHAAELVRAHSAGDANAALLIWIEAAMQLYKQELVNVDPDRLRSVQAQVQQLEMLGLLVAGAIQTNGTL